MTEIVEYFKKEAYDISHTTCIGCGFIRVYDKRGNSYLIRFSDGLKKFKIICDAIRTDNVEILNSFKKPGVLNKKYLVYQSNK